MIKKIWLLLSSHVTKPACKSWEKLHGATKNPNAILELSEKQKYKQYREMNWTEERQKYHHDKDQKEN